MLLFYVYFNRNKYSITYSVVLVLIHTEVLTILLSSASVFAIPTIHDNVGLLYLK